MGTVGGGGIIRIHILRTGGGHIAAKGSGMGQHLQSIQRGGGAHIGIEVHIAGRINGAYIEEERTIHGAIECNGGAAGHSGVHQCIRCQRHSIIKGHVIGGSGDIRTQVNACGTGHRNGTAGVHGSVDINLAGTGNQRRGASGIAAGNDQVTGGFSDRQVTDRTGAGDGVGGIASTVSNQIDDAAVAAGDIDRGGIDIQAAVEITDGVGRGQRQRADVAQAGAGILVIDGEAQQSQIDATKVCGFSANCTAAVIQLQICHCSGEHADVGVA